jgi:hypothetical protein
MQGCQINTLMTQDDKVNEVMKSLELWRTDIERNISDKFTTFESDVRTAKQTSHKPAGFFAETDVVIFLTQ